MDRVDRKMTAIPGTCLHQVHISFTSYASLFICIMSNKDKHERKRAYDQLQDVVKQLLYTEACYHTSLENCFEVEPVNNKQPCRKFCLSCDGSICKSTGVFFRCTLMLVLATNSNDR